MLSAHLVILFQTNGLELKCVVNDNIKLKFHGCYFEVKCW